MDRPCLIPDSKLEKTMSKITKIKVSNGIYWIEIPEADLFIMCGCPPDSVKHLMKRGLIVTTEQDGVSFETGPNAILLSDVMLQGDDIANMAEFPVLQMLYRQGMILPNHPGNTGVKPLLIGNNEQLRAQMAYIYRGNYGLVSEEEIMAAGVSKEDADEIMRLKLKFAFGTIKESEELLDTCTVHNDPVEIRNGVTIQRLQLNVFKIKFKNDSVRVDLNLKSGEKYLVPYPLGFHNIKREYFSVIHSGEGDGWDVNRPCMGSILMYQGQIYLIDAGPNIHNTLLSLGIGISEIKGIFHTHAHDDHFSGLTTLMRADHRIHYFATPLVRASVTKKLSALIDIDEKIFKQFFQVEDLEFDTWNDIDGLEVKPVFSPHPVETSIFVFRTLWDGGYRSYAHFADIVSRQVLESMVTSSHTEPGISAERSREVQKAYLEPVTLKKLDIGGGMIHGEAKDFSEDRSDTIILSHIAAPLTLEQKNIGSEANFGTTDVLVPNNMDYMHLSILEHLKVCFPTASDHNIRVLLNNSIITLNPGTILIKSGESVERVYLLLTGYVEKISESASLAATLSAGARIGEFPAMIGGPSSSTYRTASYVHVLSVPADLYTTVMKQCGQSEFSQQMRNKRKFLQDTWLFGEGISSTIQNRLAEQIRLHTYSAGHEFEVSNSSDLFVVSRGQAQLSVGQTLMESVAEGDFFGEDGFFGMPYLFNIHCSEPLEVYQIPEEAIRDIPIVRWKLYETLRKRRRLLLIPESGAQSLLVWKDAYSVKHEEMDDQHRQIFKYANRLYEAIDLDLKKSRVEETLSELIEFTISHFNMEEALIEDCEFPGLERQKEQHQLFISRISSVHRAVIEGHQQLEMDFLDFFKDWLVYHILTDDRQYASYVSEK